MKTTFKIDCSLLKALVCEAVFIKDGKPDFEPKYLPS